MPTSLTTTPIKLTDGSYYKPVVKRWAITSLSSGDTISVTHAVHQYRAARAYLHCKSISAGSTIQWYLQTGDSSAVTIRGVRSSSGVGAFETASTSVQTQSFKGLGRYLTLKVSEAGGGDCTGIFFDMELI